MGTERIVELPLVTEEGERFGKECEELKTELSGAILQ